jgi:PhnB protein
VSTITKLNPYISFKDNAREAMEFYKTVFGGNLVLNNFKDSHASQDPSEDNKIMHAQLDTDNGFTLMGADTPNSMEFHEGARVSISLSGENEEELRNYWTKLSEGGNIHMPLEKAPWGDTFGMLEDKFRIEWMVNILGKKE